ncbi:TadE/TadG family type IV pilus assembly protein [Orrella sp. JC864]|uniref:TadE/TadG family type IV pilus assembly protein n=1 Tax=Orrella sp. JC864 TaxID=3120298 RepID=UPI003008917F
MTRITVPPAGRRPQRGAAAIEFGLTIVLLLMVLFAILTYGSLFWIQQSLSQAAGEGARAAFIGGQQSLADAQALACRTAERSAGWLNMPDPAPARARCRSEPIACAGAPAPDLACFRITVDYRTEDWPLLATLRGLASVFADAQQIARWIPERLAAQAVVQVVSESS